MSYLAMALGPAEHGVARWYRRVLDAYYRHQARRYDAAVIEKDGERYGRPLEAGLAALAFQPQKILDLNTGTGYAALRLKEFFPHAKVIGTDLAGAMLERAREKASRHRVDIAFVYADSATLPFESAEFDLVTVQNAPLSLRESLRVLRPGGQLLLSYTSGALIPRYWLKRLEREISRFGAQSRITQCCGDGIFVLVTK
jgi:ubiquinone/menaquinone biosynthesis C-methylase UbiE